MRLDERFDFFMNIPLAKPDLTDLEKKYILEVLASEQLSFGEKLNSFENAFRSSFNAKYAVAMNSGTSALHVAVKTLGLKKGDEVITTPYSFIASSNCLLYEGVKPVFVDIDPNTLNMDTSLIEKAITPNTKAILVVHIFGQSCNMDDILYLAKKYNLYIIEDACEAIGAKWEDQYVGLFGDIGVFAFYPNKQITTGEGGMLVTNNEEVYKLACSLRNQGRNIESEWLEHQYIGYNYRMSELQAALGLAQMERLNEILEKRKLAAENYLNLIKKYQLPIQTPYHSPQSTISWFVFIIILSENINRDLLIKALAKENIQTKPYFPSIHLQPFYKQLFNYRKCAFPNSEKASSHTLAIPFYSNIRLEEQEYVISTLADLLKNMSN